MFTPEAVAGYTSTALFTIINLLVTYFVLYRLLFKPIMKVLVTRRENLEQQLKDSETKAEEAACQIAEANRRIQQSSREAGEIVANARSQADVQSESILSDARKQAAGMVSRADAEIARMRTTMLNEVRDEVADLSVAIASKVIGHVMDQKQQQDLVELYLDEHMAPAAAGTPATAAAVAPASDVPASAAPAEAAAAAAPASTAPSAEAGKR